MVPIRVMAIATEVAEAVRRDLKAPGYGHPAHVEVATGYGPCRHCLCAFNIGVERRILFTFDPFEGIESVPLPGPVFIHADPCERYKEDASYPKKWGAHSVTLVAFARGRRQVTEEHVEAGAVRSVIERLLARTDVDYIHVRDHTAGCYDFRIERQDGRG
ncbi:MAG: DUF1203 domain-containing protein [Terriglobales bacterium]